MSDSHFIDRRKDATFNSAAIFRSVTSELLAVD